MKLITFKASWGMNGGWESQFKRIAEAGYSGIETGMPSEQDEANFKELLIQYDLKLILQVYTDGDPITSFEKQVERAAGFKPLLINSHSAKDSMPYEDQLRFFEQALLIEKEVKIPVGHETHRGRATYTPWSTARLLRDLPDLRIVADFSHWCCVCESMLEDREDDLALAIERAIHIHARVGYEHGPQVPDFRAPEYESALHRHESWWDEIAKRHKQSGSSTLTMTPEFGPPGYMHTLPYTNQPVIDLWDICYAMRERFIGRFEKQFS
jgi:sugar phosphate isomerase/epimerase